MEMKEILVGEGELAAGLLTQVLVVSLDVFHEHLCLLEHVATHLALAVVLRESVEALLRFWLL